METTTLHQETMALLMRFYDVTETESVYMNGKSGFQWELNLYANRYDEWPDRRWYPSRQAAQKAAEEWITSNAKDLVAQAKREAIEGRAYRARKAA